MQFCLMVNISRALDIQTVECLFRVTDIMHDANYMADGDDANYIR